jgi:peptide chain release factor subunit 1
MKNDLDEIVKELSNIFDPGSKNTYVTLYIRNKISNRFFEKRKEACKAALSGDEQKNFIKTIEKINEFLKKNVDFKGVIFASNKYQYFKTIELPIEIKDSLIVDSSPYISPLTRILDEWESFTLILLNSNYAKIFSISLGKVDKEKNLSADIMNKHKKGGCSQARFQRLRKGAINAFFSEVGEALIKGANSQIVLAGPGQAKLHFKDTLSKNIQDRIVATIDIDVDDEKELLKHSINLISELEEKKSIDAVKQLKEEILKDGLAAYGVEETLEAVKNGQVELLIILKDYKIRGFICEHCQVVKTDFIKTCPFCGGVVSEVDVLEEILEFAKRTDAAIEFTDDEEMVNLGYVGAILRFK